MSFRSPSLLARRILAATAIAAAAGAVLPATANADVTPTTLVNGVLSTIGGCQTPSRDAILACTRFETLTTQFPVVLDLNPFGTNIVALGAGLFPNGTMRPVLESRMQATLQVAHRYPLSPIIVSGGVPQNGITESRAMRDWLIGHGIPAFRITEEYTSRSTVENARNTNAILAQRGATSAVVVTSPDHLQRAMVDFRVAVGGRIPIAGVVAP
ncbi:YdcF family protein [Rhodococcus oryzae]|uniref:YdcF family protein n=1 Tax=Rhodococcus oryzae TaxID=2571143 RepID=A0ABY2RP50_9NOCA|nr:YdcF family protein [Rhodococcus oryzae]TJZ80238.1 YdcF family protein [Rhodococcus oryzae]